MALPDSEKLVDGTSFIFAFDTDWPASPTQGWSATVDAEIDLGGLTNGSGRQSVKVDLTDNRDVEYKVEVSMETDADATEGQTVDVHVGFSDSATAGTGNPGGLVGTDSAYTGGSGGSLAGGLKLLEFAGSLIMQATNDTDGVPQVGMIRIIKAHARYMAIVVVNNSGATLGSGGTGLADELAVRVTGITRQLQE